MEDFFRAYMGDGKKNCDWSILYVIIVVFIIIIGVCLLLYFITCYCVRRRKHVRYSKKKNYVLVENGKIDKHSKSNGYKRKNGFKRTSENFKTTALMRSMTSTSSDEDQAVFEKRKLINRPKGGGRLKRLKAQKPQPHKTLIDLKDQVSGAEISGDSFDGMGLDENSAILLNSTAKNIHNNDIL
uniref:Uncharacterized protein n=1 Tax=Ciona savignyi TaxID=51511 RepID=H2YLW9_CIOSA